MNGDDANRMWDAINAQAKELAGIATNTAVMAEQLKAIRKTQDEHGNPCASFKAHLEKHEKADEEARKTWREAAMEFLKPAITAAGVAAAMWFGLGSKHP